MGQEKNQPAAGYQMIVSPQALSDFADMARQQPMVAVDVEADSMFHYREKVCLIQMAAAGQTVVIDPLALDDLTPLKPLMADKNVCKVLHGADYDIRSLYRDFKIRINNLFDTQIASMYLGADGTGLDAVLTCRFGIHLDKKYQKKNWAQRPLPEEMIAYAASDVIYLIPLAEQLIDELQQAGRFEWVIEECRRLSRVRPPKDNNDPMFLKCKGAGRLPPRQLAVLESLLKWRDRQACKKDRPLFKVVSNAALMKIAVAMPTSRARLAACGALSARQIDMFGTALLEAVRNAKDLEQTQLPAYPRQRAPRVSAKVPGRIRAIKAWRDPVAEQMTLDPSLILNKTQIGAIAVDNPATMTALRRVDGLAKWQVDTFGRQILDTLAAHHSPRPGRRRRRRRRR